MIARFRWLSSASIKNILLQNKVNPVTLTIIRNEHKEYLYRKTPPINEPQSKPIVIIGSILWWWVLWHFFCDYHELLGHNYPNPLEWTNEELGIPED